jgi:hypothetical protein
MLNLAHVVDTARTITAFNYGVRRACIINGVSPKGLTRTLTGYLVGKYPPNYPVPAVDVPCYRDYARGDLTLMSFIVALLH